MTETTRSLRLVSEHPKDLAQLAREINEILRDDQLGKLLRDGLNLDARRTVAPTALTEPGQPNLVAVTISGTRKLLINDISTGFVVAGTQT